MNPHGQARPAVGWQRPMGDWRRCGKSGCPDAQACRATPPPPLSSPDGGNVRALPLAPPAHYTPWSPAIPPPRLPEAVAATGEEAGGEERGGVWSTCLATNTPALGRLGGGGGGSGRGYAVRRSVLIHDNRPASPAVCVSAAGRPGQARLFYRSHAMSAFGAYDTEGVDDIVGLNTIR